MTGKSARWALALLVLALAAVLLNSIPEFRTTPPPETPEVEVDPVPDIGEVPPPSTDPKLVEVLSRIPDDELLDHYPDEAYETLVRLRDSGEWSGGPDRVAEAERLLAETSRHLTRLHEDTTYRAHYHWRTSLPLFAQYQPYSIRVASRPPHLLFFMEKFPSKGAAPKAERLTAVLQGFYEAFHRLIGAELELPRLRESLPPGEAVLKVVVFSNPRVFREYQASIGATLPPTVFSRYSPGDQFVTLALGTHGATDHEVSTADAHRLITVAFQQLLHAYTRVMVEAETGGKVQYEDKRMRCRLFWLQSGLMGLLSGGFSSDDEPYDLARPLRSRLDEWREWMECGHPDWSLARLLEIGARPDPERKCAMMARTQGNMRLASAYQSLAYAQSWAFCHFLWNHEKGKYRSKLLEALRGCLSGHSRPKDWERIWTGGQGKPDWDALEAEWRRYVVNLP